MTVKELIDKLTALSPEAQAKPIAFEGLLRFLNPDTREVKAVQKCGELLSITEDPEDGHVYVRYA